MRAEDLFNALDGKNGIESIKQYPSTIIIHLKKDIDLLSVYMSLLISSQIILDDCELLYKINCEIKEDQVEFEPCAIQYLQYCLFLISEDHPCPPIPGLYQKSDQFQIHQLIQYIERI